MKVTYDVEVEADVAGGAASDLTPKENVLQQDN